MVAPSGFWLSGTAGQEEFAQDLMNACLVQIGTKATVDALLDRAGMIAFSSDDHRFWRSNGSALVNMGIVEFDVDANKPTASAANNGRVFFATDTLTLYVVDGGTQYLVSDQNVVVDHVALGDPHTQYQKESEKNAANGYAGLDAGGIVLQSDLPDHATRHPRGAADEIDGDVIDIDYTPSVYVPDTAPAEVTNVDELTSHLKGIDNAIGSHPIKSHTQGRRFHFIWSSEDELTIVTSGLSTLATHGGHIVLSVRRDSAGHAHVRLASGFPNVTDWDIAANVRLLVPVNFNSVANWDANASFFVGLRDTPGNALPTSSEDMVGFDHDGTNFRAVNANGTTLTFTNLTEPSENDVKLLEFIVTSATNIVFKINGTIVATHTTNLPTGIDMEFHLIGVSGGGGAAANSPELGLGTLTLEEDLD